jgi:hypothetical protein
VEVGGAVGDAAQREHVEGFEVVGGAGDDGSAWIAYPETNFRWNDSPISVLSNIDAMSESVRASPRESTATNISVPALRVKEFELSSVWNAV